MKINLSDKAGLIKEHWHPYIVGELNENYVKIARIKGEFVWHSHEEEDELFFIIKGTLLMDFRNKETVTAKEGEVLIIPKGVEHRPRTQNDMEVIVMLVEPKSTLHTGDVVTEKTVTNLEWI